MYMTKEEFIAAATAAAQASSATSGFPPGVTVAQAALESAWGNSGLAQAANNYFGIKARPGGEAIELPTLEYVGGVPFASRRSLRSTLPWRSALPTVTA